MSVETGPPQAPPDDRSSAPGGGGDGQGEGQRARALSTAAASRLATTTKSVPQTQGITPRWLLRMLPWVEAPGGTYRVNRRLTDNAGDGLISLTRSNGDFRVVPGQLGELPPLRGYGDQEVLSQLAARFEQRRYGPGEVIAQSGSEADGVSVIAHGKVVTVGAGKYGGDAVIGTLAEGRYLGEQVLAGAGGHWAFTAKTATACTVLFLPREDFASLAAGSAGLTAHLEAYLARRARPWNKRGEADVTVAAGHVGEPGLPGTFVDYDTCPREYHLSLAQTVVRVHTRVADLYSDPMDQVEQQVRLTVEALRERQEAELLTNPGFGLLRNAAPAQRISTRGGPPAPADLDDLLSRRRKTRLFLAHPRAIAAFGRACTRDGVYPGTVDVDGRQVMAWRGVPVLPCPKIPIAQDGTTSILAMRTGEDDEGVVGLRQTGLPDEREPGLNVRFTHIGGNGVACYLVSAYYSAAILVPDALGILDNVETGR